MRLAPSSLPACLLLGLIVGLLGAACAGTYGPAEHYDRGVSAVQRHDWPAASRHFAAAGDYLDAPYRAARARENVSALAAAYDQAAGAIAAAHWTEAYTHLETLRALNPDYRDVPDLYRLVGQRLDAMLADAAAAVGRGDLNRAIDLYLGAGSYGQADALARSWESTRARLDLLYGLMDAAELDGAWDRALDLSRQVAAAVPAYRDVTDRRARYLDRVYAAAMAASARHDWQEATRLLGLITTATPRYRDAEDRLAVLRRGLASVPTGTYQLTRGMGRLAELVYTLTSVEVRADGRLRATVAIRNTGAVLEEFRCGLDATGDAPVYLVAADGTRMAAEETYCTSRRGALITLRPGEVHVSYAVFPPLVNGAEPFALHWYDGLGVGDIVLAGAH